jgi:hypothetical protein
MKHFVTTDIMPVDSEQRKAIANSIPIFFFSGSVEIGTSGVWSPPHNIRLVNGWCQAKTTGTSMAGFVVMKTDSFDTLTIMSQVQMPANIRRAAFSFGEFQSISPYEQLFIASFGASGHEDVGIQIYGERE